MDIALSVAAFLLSIVGIVGCIVPALPGVVLSYAGLLCAYFTSYSSMSPAAIWLWLAITVAVSVADYFLPAWMTRRFGGSRSGAIGATVGVFAGFFFFPPVGIILGPFFGAVLGEPAQRPPRRGQGVSGRHRLVPLVRRRHGHQTRGGDRHVRPCDGRHLPRRPGLVRNSFLTLSIMRKFLLFAVVIAAMLAAACSKYKYETVAGDPLNTRIYTLDNGLKVYMSVNKEAPRIQTYIAVKVGGKNDPAETTGLAHYFEHLMFKGTQQFGTSDYAAEKPMLDEIESLFEVYRKTADEAERAAIYRRIDSISYEGTENRHSQRVRQGDVGHRRQRHQRLHVAGHDGLRRGHSLEPDRQLGQNPSRPFQESRDPRLPYRALRPFTRRRTCP